MIKTLLTLAGAAILAFGLVTGAPPARAQEAAEASAVRAGDDALTCAQLGTEAAALQAEMDGMTGEIQTAAAAQIRAARAAQGAATASSVASSLASQIPFIGGLIGSVAARAVTSGVEAQQDRMLELSERMLTRAPAIGARLQRVEILRSARCGTGQGAAAAADANPAGRVSAPDRPGT